MQNNVTHLTQRLLQSLDSNYNVINMHEVNEILSLLEKVAITKEVLEATRLGKHVNELRRKTTNESLSRRAKELVKRWRSIFLPESNGPLKQNIQNLQPEQEDSVQNQNRNKKRAAKDALDNVNIKRAKLNGQISELDFSDNSNSSFKEVLVYNLKSELKHDAMVNSDSNSSIPNFKHDVPQVEQHLPKKRGRKKGSTNHKKLVDEAESSFTNKLAVSRGNSKVKTTQELIASFQNKNNNALWNPYVRKEDLNERAAKLTERVSIIDQKLNTNSHRYKNSQRKSSLQKQSACEKIIESGSVINDKNWLNSTNQSSTAEDEIIIVDDIEPQVKIETGEESLKSDNEAEVKNKVKSLSIEEALSQLPPIDKNILEEREEEPYCTCTLRENIPDFSVDIMHDHNLKNTYEFIEDPTCLAKAYLESKYHLGCVSEDKARYLHSKNIPNVNGNFSNGFPKGCSETDERGLYLNVVPNVNNETLAKDFSGENYKKYCISDTENGYCFQNERTNSGDVFREWHEVVETPSYNGEMLKILPYVIID